MADLTSFTLGEIAVRERAGLFSLNDLHRASGGEERHQPAKFVRLDQTQALIAELSKSPDMANSNAGISTIESQRGADGGTFACRELVVAYAAWISPAFHIRVLRVFLVSASETTQLQVQVRELLAEKAQRTLADNPRLAYALRVHHKAQAGGLTHEECARLMGWKTAATWAQCLRELAALGLIEYHPNPARSAAGQRAFARLLAHNAQHGQTPAQLAARQANAQRAHAAQRAARKGGAA